MYMYVCLYDSTSTTWHIAFPPTTGGVSLHVWMDPSNVDSVLHWSYLEGNRAIRMSCNYFVRSRVGLLVLVFSTYVKHDFVTRTIFMWDAFSIFPSVVHLNQLLFVLSYNFPVCGMFDIEYHISAKDQLAWGTMQGSMIRASDSKCCGT